jgi:ribonuclease HI
MVPRGHCILSKVAEVIDPISGQWDTEIIQSNFHQIDVNRILQIPLSIDGFDDFLAWHGTRSGRFSVRSAYHTEWRHQFNGVTCRSLITGTPLDSQIWRLLWKLQVPAKVKIYCWRILHGLIPLKNILFKRHIGTDGICPICKSEEEDVLHMLFNCPEAELIWNGLGITGVIQNAKTNGSSGSEVLASLLNMSSLTVPGFDSIHMRELVAVASWYIWWLRRTRSHGEQVPPIRQCITSIHAITSNNERIKTSTEVHDRVVWVKPRNNYVKVNTDAAFIQSEEAGATGAVIRDNQGGFLAAGSTFIPHVSSASMAEALAMCHGLKLARDLGYTTVQAESDSLEVIQLCTGTERIWNDATAIYAEILECAGSIGVVEFMHCRRETNKVAHDIARHCFRSRISCTWVDEPPSFLLQPLLHDVTTIL